MWRLGHVTRAQITQALEQYPNSRQFVLAREGLNIGLSRMADTGIVYVTPSGDYRNAEVAWLVVPKNMIDGTIGSRFKVNVTPIPYGDSYLTLAPATIGGEAHIEEIIGDLDTENWRVTVPTVLIPGFLIGGQYQAVRINRAEGGVLLIIHG